MSTVERRVSLHTNTDWTADIGLSHSSDLSVTQVEPVLLYFDLYFDYSNLWKWQLELDYKVHSNIIKPLRIVNMAQLIVRT